MSKDKLPPIREDYDPNEWGNLGNDERLLDPKINYKIAAKDRMADINVRNKLKESRKLQNTPEYLEHMSKQRIKSMDKAIDETGITLREKLTAANRKSAKDPIAHANRTAANRRLKNDPTWQKNHRKACIEKAGNEFMSPKGKFDSFTLFKEQYNINPASLLQKLPHLFYKIEDGKGEEVYERLYNTPYGVAITFRHAKELAIQHNDPSAIKMKNSEGWWLKMCYLYPKDYYCSFEIAVYWPLEKSYPYGAIDTPSKTIKKDKLQKSIDAWNNRLEKLKLVYKKI